MSRSEQASRGFALCGGLARESPMSPETLDLLRQWWKVQSSPLLTLKVWLKFRPYIGQSSAYRPHRINSLTNSPSHAVTTNTSGPFALLRPPARATSRRRCACNRRDSTEALADPVGCAHLQLMLARQPHCGPPFSERVAANQALQRSRFHPLGSVSLLRADLARLGIVSKRRQGAGGRLGARGGGGRGGRCAASPLPPGGFNCGEKNRESQLPKVVLGVKFTDGIE